MRVVTLNGSSSSHPPCPVSAVKETLFIREIRNYIPRAVRHAFWLFQLMYHTQLSSVRLLHIWNNRNTRCSVPPPSNEIGESVLIVLAFDRSARSIFHWVKGHLFHILISHSGTWWLGIFYPPLVPFHVLSANLGMSSRKPRKAQPRYIPSSLLVVFSVSSSVCFILVA